VDKNRVKKNEVIMKKEGRIESPRRLLATWKEEKTGRHNLKQKKHEVGGTLEERILTERSAKTGEEGARWKEHKNKRLGEPLVGELREER